MINVSYYFKVRVTYKYKIFASDTFKTDTAEYEIVLNNIKSDSYSEANAVAKKLCEEEYGDLPYYKYVGLDVCEKKIIHIKN